MEDIVLKLDKREVTGKAVKHLRKEGLVPAVIHDHGKESIHVQGEYVQLAKAFQKAGKHHPVQLQAGDKKYTALIKHADFEPRKHMLRHVVFNAVTANQTVDAEIPVRIKYAEGEESTPAERASLVVLNQLEVVEVEAFPRNLPDAIEFDGEKLVAAGDVVTVADLIVPEGVVIKTDPTHPVATVFEPSALQAANDAAGGDADEDTAVVETDQSEAVEAKAEGAAAGSTPEKQ
ncbi:MAG TPA: 50S ribosomal protein L25 [Candidatus Saccharimonadales bacterium]|nr:50S ribosomal protein L25 [Candidatus Saccharimonadales bacterium]